MVLNTRRGVSSMDCALNFKIEDRETKGGENDSQELDIPLNEENRPQLETIFVKEEKIDPCVLPSENEIRKLENGKFTGRNRNFHNVPIKEEVIVFEGDQCFITDEEGSELHSSFNDQDVEDNEQFNILASEDIAEENQENELMNKIGGEQPFTCAECKCAFITIIDLSLHFQTVHDDKKSSHGSLKPHKCKICEKNFSRRDHLTYHIKSVHDKIKPFKCTICESSFCYGNRLTHHMKSVHDKIKPYQCTVCESSFCYESHLNRHVQSVHEKYKPHKCTLCESAFRERGKLLSHIKSVHKKLRPFKCDQCEQTFGDKNHLAYHIKSVHDKIKPYKCTFCESSFCYESYLNRHILSVHEKLKPHKCTQCESTFSERSNLLAHIQSVHEKLKPHKCTVCERTFNRRDHLVEHIKSIHVKNKALTVQVVQPY